MIAAKGLFAPVIAVRKGRGVTHLAQQNGEYMGSRLFESTLCGRTIEHARDWTELAEAATCQRCEKANELLEDSQRQDIADAHAEAIQEDIRRFPGWTDADDRIEAARDSATDSAPEEAPSGPVDIADAHAEAIEEDAQRYRRYALELAVFAALDEFEEAENAQTAVRATAALLGTSEEKAREHLGAIHRSTVVDVSAQDVIAAAYDALPELDTFRPGSLAELAWEAFAHETLSQADVLRSLGVRWSAVDVDPYANAGELFAELRSTRSIRVLSSRSTGGHPFLSDTVNDTFRAVHDILGHAATGRGFDRHGEEAAYQAHAALYSPLARQALATETRGQNASMHRAGGVFPPQRIAILPEWARATDALKPSRGRYDAHEIADMRADAARDHAAQGLGEWVGQ